MLYLFYGLTIMLTTAVYAAGTYAVSTFAGLAGESGDADGTGPTARFHNPTSITYGSGHLYVTDSSNKIIRKITSTGVVTTITEPAKFNHPTGIAYGLEKLYVADYGNGTVRKITNGNGVSSITKLADFKGKVDSTGYLQLPFCLTYGSGNLYVASFGNTTIRKVTNVDAVSSIAKSVDTATSYVGSATTAGMTVDGTGNLYITDYENNTIIRITSDGEVTTIAGLAGAAGYADGYGTESRFASPYGITVDGSGNLFVVDQGNQIIRKLTYNATHDTYKVSTIAGLAGATGHADGSNNHARFFNPWGITIDDSDNLFVADQGNQTIRKLTLVPTIVISAVVTPTVQQRLVPQNEATISMQLIY